MSASSQTVLRGIWSRDRDMLCAMARRGPRTGSDVVPDGAVGLLGAAAPPRGPRPFDSPCSRSAPGAAGSSCPSTSSRVIKPARPLPARVERSTPKRLASARAAGAARMRASEPLRSRPTGADSTYSSSLVVGMVPTTVPESKSISGAPVATMSPTAPCNAVTTPLYGTGTSTTAFAVSTDTIGWSTRTRSPGRTCHSRISASANPSPKSGSLNVLMRPPLAGQSEAHRIDDALYARNIVVLEPKERHDGVEPGDALDGQIGRAHV